MSQNAVIQGLWIGPELSKMEQLSIRSFLAHGHSYHLYIYEDVCNVPCGAVVKDADEILPRKAVFAYPKGPEKGGLSGFANLFRYKLLLEKGGWGVDLDVVCLKPWDFEAPYVFSAEWNPKHRRIIHAGILKAPAGSPFIRECYEQASRLDTGTIAFRQNGKKLLEPLMASHGLESFIVSPRTFCPLDWWEWPRLTDRNFKFRIPGESYGIHLWHDKWRRHARRRFRKRLLDFFLRRPRIRKNIRYPEETLYGYLQARYL